MARADPVTVAILAKAPIPGLAKTRLIPALGAEGAAALQERLILRAIEMALAADVGRVTVWTTADHAVFHAAAQRYPIALERQPEGDLGARMLSAVAAAEGPVLLIGSDCPPLKPEHLRMAAEALWDGIDAVVMLADDGGYVLIGMNAPCPALFDAMPWSTARVMAETRRRLARAGLTWREPARLWDIDVPEDIGRAQREGFGALFEGLDRLSAAG